MVLWHTPAHLFVLHGDRTRSTRCPVDRPLTPSPAVFTGLCAHWDITDGGLTRTLTHTFSVLGDLGQGGGVLICVRGSYGADDAAGFL